ncbi:MAG: enoyl-CoA hydratase/isomerase family protein [Burkholderiales bacterium]|jgi:enoyl-CoA hydratase|nr:enoyl-CoA hydratase/isomerase family protein [Burkholderiales bacterium]
MSDQNLLLEQPEPGVCLLTVNRPKALNALNAATLDELLNALATVAGDAAARALLVTGAGERAFVAGADIAEMAGFTAAQAQAFSEHGMRVMSALEALPVPVIALVNGYALGGGCELALACDWIIAAENAVFGQPEVNLGIPPGFGGTQRLARIVGRARALELVTTARQLRAAEALAIGLVNEVVPAAALRERGLEVARSIAAKGPQAVRLAKQAVHRGLDQDLAGGCAYETAAFALAFATADQREGMRAFLEKRAAKFSGR